MGAEKYRPKKSTGKPPQSGFDTFKMTFPRATTITEKNTTTDVQGRSGRRPGKPGRSMSKGRR